MKNLVIALILVCGVTAFAQENRRDRKERGEASKEMRAKMSDLTAEQQAELASKRMTLHLDLTEKQQVAVEKLELEKATQRKAQFKNKKDRKELSDTERFELKTKMLDEKIAYKKEMKSILTDDQYEKWEKGHKGKNRRGKGKNKKDRKKR